MFRGHSTREPASSRVTYLFCGPTQEPVLATANTGKTRERFWGKNAGEWTGRIAISKKEILGSRRSMHGCIRTCSRLKRVEALSSEFSQQMESKFLRSPSRGYTNVHACGQSMFNMSMKML